MIVDELKLTRSYAFCRVWGSAEEHVLHVHDCLEIGVLLKHHLEYRFGDRTYKGKPGDVFLCRPFEPHWSFAEPNEPPYESILVLFMPSALKGMPDWNRLLLPFYTNEEVPPYIPGDSPYAGAICKAAEEAALAQEQQASNWMTRQYMHLIDILLQVSDFAASYAPSGVDQQRPAIRLDIMDAIGYLLQHYTEPVDGTVLLDRSHSGKTKFFHEFRALTGLSPNEFLNRLRVQHAMDLLRTTSSPIIDIAESSGFGSLSAFNKQFKQYTEASPREYRARMTSD
ncbi:AraC-like DNA-binding protein [Paenibacillus taihuensis]|uniref:AraC-like DNA-binding protein n=1 Tax=Paenibacillus taihuensis TaxID=1156355 RepID=A0A3D9SCX2_9BACL|nr:AraC family transcriptional regulator [Paenibacillus taihuensis]REE92729.1 AraC-like DNA-binding protein [Paenibacillus taihuensis]